MSRAVLVLIAVLLSGGCACTPLGALTVLGVGVAVVTHDPSHAVAPGGDFVGCLLDACRRP